MTDKSVNPQAFPVAAPVRQFGMTLRDYFAGQALAGMWADTEVVGSAERVADNCYRLADAMLKERMKEGDDLS